MEDLQRPKIGDSVFTGQFEDIAVSATVNKLVGDEYWAEIRLSGTPAAAEWQADSVNDNFDVFAFGVWFDGPGLPVWWGDIDSDGKPELLAPLPKGDVSPPIFRIFRWTGDDLLFLKKRTLVESGEGRFEWSRPDAEMVDGAWVDGFSEGKVEVVSLREGKVDRRTVDFKPTKEGIELAK